MGFKLLLLLALTVTLDGGTPVDNVGLVTVYKDGQEPSITGGEDCSGDLTLVPRVLRSGKTAHTFKREEMLGFRLQGVLGETGTIAFRSPTDSPLGVTTATGKLVTIATCAGEFDEANVDSGCLRTGVNNHMDFHFGTPDGTARCHLDPSTTYFLSIRNWSAGKDTCSEGELCGTVLFVNREAP